MKLPLRKIGRPVQLSQRVYEVLLDSILGVKIGAETPLRIDAIASQLGISSTPVRDALNRLEKDGLIVKQPYQSWVVRKFHPEEVRELYELRAGVECFAVRLACQRITADGIEWLKNHQKEGEEAIRRNDMEAYQTYNKELHAAIFKFAKNSQLSKVMDALSLQLQMLMAQTIRFSGRPARALREHAALIDAMERGSEQEAQRIMEDHLMAALEDILKANTKLRFNHGR
ncbi:MAG TPA: GntR family transcriptional regulator [Acidobacteriota bacterium]|nr:GntR family transcriptional regulator [Acidobacteriota bacterium]